MKGMFSQLASGIAMCNKCYGCGLGHGCGLRYDGDKIKPDPNVATGCVDGTSKHK